MKYNVCKDLVSQEAEDGIIVVDTTNGVIHELNETAMAVWMLLKSTKEYEKIVDDLRKVFEDVKDEIVKETIKQMVERGLIEEVSK